MVKTVTGKQIWKAMNGRSEATGQLLDDQQQKQTEPKRKKVSEKCFLLLDKIDPSNKFVSPHFRQKSYGRCH